MKGVDAGAVKDGAPDGRGERLAGRGLAMACLAAFLLAALALALHAPLFHAGRLHVGGVFGDQASHITTARTLAETGELRSGLVYPAFADRPDWHPYMPGHHVVLAAAYRALGFGTLSSLLPNLLGFCLATVGVLLIGNHVGGRHTAWLAAGLFALFPPDLNYALTAMAESTLAGACALALALFLLAPERRRPWLAAPLLLVPFLFRETAALYVVPMAFVIARGGARRRPGAALVAVLASVLLLGAVDRALAASGKGFPMWTWVQHGNFNYADALGARPPDLTAGEWAAALFANAGRNLHQLAAYAADEPWNVRTTGLALLLAALVAAVVRAVRRREPLFVGTALLAGGMVVVVLFLYDVKGQKALRSLLFCAPLLAVTAAASLGPLLSRRRALGVGLLLAALAAQHLVARQAAAELTASDEVVDASTAVLESLHHDDSTLLIVAFELFPYTLDYAVRHWPVPWAWMPGNAETTELLLERYTLGTLIISPDAFPGREPPMITSIGNLRFRRQVDLGRREYFVYQR